MTYGVQTWEIIQIGDRIDTTEIIDTDYYGSKTEALEAAEGIQREKPEGVARVTVGRFDDNGEIMDDEYIIDEMI